MNSHCLPSSVVETTSGKLRGLTVDGVHIFRGIPYAGDTAGPHRFLAPRPTTWTGVRDAFDYGPRSPQNEPPTTAPWLLWLRDRSRAGEDCLNLNIFTPASDPSRRLPVMVYFHGGAFVVSSGNTPGVDGSNLARRNVVVVTVNHRLNLFGFLHAGDADGGRYATSANAGMLDCVAALTWVRDNIAQFGGDAGNVTIFGQSGGGSKVATLMAMPLARGLFHKAIIQSASSLLRMATREEAEHSTHCFLHELGLGRAQFARLHEIPAEALLAAMPRTVQAAGQRDHFRPVVDGHILPSQPFDGAALALSARIPLMLGWAEHEQRLAFAGTPQVYDITAADALARTARALDVPADQAAHLMDTYRHGRPDDSPGDLYAQIFGDHRYRRSVTRAAEVHAPAQRASSTWLYFLRWRSPVANGLLRCPHTLCIAFAFGNVDAATGITGTGPDRYRLQDEMAGAWTAFAHSGHPDHAALPGWPAFSQATRATMVFDRQSRVEHDPMTEERVAFEPYPRYLPAMGEGRRTW